MNYDVRTTTVQPTPLLVVRRRGKGGELSRIVPDACGVVWKFAREVNAKSPGRHVAVYLNGMIDMEIGVEVGGHVDTSGEVIMSKTPAGRVVTTAHIGPYSGLHGAHDAIREWCSAHHERTAGPSWEVYGHWTDDQTKLRTDVFYLLSPNAEA